MSDMNPKQASTHEYDVHRQLTAEGHAATFVGMRPETENIVERYILTMISQHVIPATPAAQETVRVILHSMVSQLKVELMSDAGDDTDISVDSAKSEPLPLAADPLLRSSGDGEQDGEHWTDQGDGTDYPGNLSDQDDGVGAGKADGA